MDIGARQPETLRLFVAIELGDDLRRALGETMRAIERRGITRQVVRWVRPEGIHVTLKFLGETPAARVPAIRNALAAAVRGMSPFDLKPEGLGTFGGQRTPRVVWVGVGGDTAALATLAGRVEAARAPMGFPAESRPFAAHLTLARVRDDAPAADRGRISGALQGTQPARLPAIRADRVSLMRSTLRRGGAVYDALATFTLE